jgi:hypothetical protein
MGAAMDWGVLGNEAKVRALASKAVAFAPTL